MEITIKGSAKEIAAFVLDTQKRPIADDERRLRDKIISVRTNGGRPRGDGKSTRLSTRTATQ